MVVVGIFLSAGLWCRVNNGWSVIRLHPSAFAPAPSLTSPTSAPLPLCLCPCPCPCPPPLPLCPPSAPLPLPLPLGWIPRWRIGGEVLTEARGRMAEK